MKKPTVALYKSDGDGGQTLIGYATKDGKGLYTPKGRGSIVRREGKRGSFFINKAHMRRRQAASQMGIPYPEPVMTVELRYLKTCVDFKRATSPEAVAS